MTTIITGIELHTMTDAGVIKNGYIAFENGKITAVGSSSDLKDTTNAKVIHETGRLFPGFIDGHTHIGLLDDSLNFEGDDVNEASDPVTPQMRGIDSIYTFDRCFEDAYKAGVTAVAAGPGSANTIGGQFAAIKLYGKRIDDMIIKTPVAMKFALGENPKSVYHGKSQSPETRMATAALIREALLKAKRYADEKDKAEASKLTGNKDDELDAPEYDAKSEALEPVVRGQLEAHFHCHRADDIYTAIRISKEFNLKYKLVHCTEGHLIVEDLAAEGAQAFIGPNLSDRSKPELRNMTFANAGILDKAGVKIGITTDHPVTPLEYLPLCAALAVKAGLDKESAYKALTVNTAEMLGINDRIGSIKPGLDADFSIFNGDPLEIFTKVKRVYINGNEVYKR